MGRIVTPNNFREKDELIRLIDNKIHWLREELKRNTNLNLVERTKIMSGVSNLTLEKERLEFNSDPIFFGIDFEKEIIRERIVTVNWIEKELNINPNIPSHEKHCLYKAKLDLIYKSHYDCNLIIPLKNTIPKRSDLQEDPFITNFFNEYDKSVKLMEKEDDK